MKNRRKNLILALIPFILDEIAYWSEEMNRLHKKDKKEFYRWVMDNLNTNFEVRMAVKFYTNELIYFYKKILKDTGKKLSAAEVVEYVRKYYESHPEEGMAKAA